MDITSLLDYTAKLSLTARNEQEENFNRNLNLMMSRMGVTDEARMQLCNNLSSASKEILGIAPGSPSHPSKDETPTRDRMIKMIEMLMSLDQ